MTRNPVASSRIAAIAYDEATAVLEVEFTPTKDGRRAVWAYEQVDIDAAERVLKAESIGRAFTEIQRGYVGHRVAIIDADGIEHPEVIV